MMILFSAFRYQQILQYEMDNNDSEAIIKTCQAHGDEDPQLWVQALSYFSKSKRADGCRKEIEQILKCLFVFNSKKNEICNY